jgi:sn1-specific diacylglycerol lipase
MRLLQLAVLIPLTVFMVRDSFNDDVGCPEERPSLIEKGPKLAVSYLVVSYVLVGVGLLLELGILLSTGRGTPTQPEKRQQVQRLCQFKMVPLSLLRIAAITLGLIVLSIIHNYCGCEDEADTALVLENECLHMDTIEVFYKILIGTHIAEACAVVVIALYFGLKCAPSPPSLMSSTRKWQLCCHCFLRTSSLITCGCFGGLEVGDFSDISMALADYFDNGGTLDIVPTDILVGLLMLLRVQEQRRLECREELLCKSDEHVEETNHESMVDDTVDPELAKLARGSHHRASLVYQMHRSGDNLHYHAEARSILLPKNVGDKIAIAEGAHFIRYARAMYTYKMDFLEMPIKAAFVFGFSAVKSLCKEKNDNVKSDNMCGSHEASLEWWTGLDRDQIPHANFSEGIGVVPYCIAIDHEWKAVVIAIRGTQALEDLITDMTLRPVSMEECATRCGFDGRDCYAHAGMLESSEWIYSQLEKYVFR